MPVQPIQMDALEFTDFSGGKTDYYINGALNKFREADNCLIIKHGDIGKLFTRPGSDIYDMVNYQIPAGAQRIGTYKYFGAQLFIHSARKFYYISGGSWNTLQGPSGNDVFPTGTTVDTVVSLSTWNKHLFIASSDFTKVQKVYKDGSGNWQLRTAGMPRPTAPTVTAGGVGTGDYLYRFLFYYTYTVGTVIYVDRGPTVEVALNNSTAPDVTPVSITNIQVLSNGAVHNYDTASSNLKAEIYRTTDDGTNFFFVGSVNNGTTTFNDTVSDTDLQDNEPLYTEDGRPENEEPPLCKFVHVMDDKGYYAHVKIGTEIFSNRIFQSIPGDIDSVPSDFFVDVQDEIAGFSSVTSNAVALGTAITYRLDGAYDELGGGFIVPTKISDTAGCVSSLSIVQTLYGIFWAGNDGFYYSDAYRVIRVSGDLDQTYQSLVASDARKRRIYGVYDPKKNRIWWSVQQGGTATDVDAIFVLDLNWGISENMPFTTISGGTNFAPTALEFVEENLIRGDTRGYTFIHRDSLYSDPKINVLTAPSTWDRSTLIYNYISVATNFGTTLARKFVPRITIDCKNETNISLQIISINDDGKRTGYLKPIRYRGNITWGDPDIYWGDVNLIWNDQGIIDEQRRFPAQNLRCQYKQIQLTNAMVAIINSELIGTCAVDGIANTATLTDTATYDWPSNAVDYYISFETDDYVREYLITARTADVLTFADVDDSAPTASGLNWVIRGKPKNEVLLLISYAVHYAIFGKTSVMFRKSGTGEVGAADD